MRATLMIVTCALGACTDRDSALIEGVPEGVSDFLSEEDLASLEDVGAEIHRGFEPPDVEGSYIADALELAYDDEGQTGSISDYRYIFSEQTEDGQLSMDSEGFTSGDSGGGQGAFIAGEGDCFTVFIEFNGENEDCVYGAPFILSGCLNDDGDIEDWSHSFVLASRVGACEGTIDEGHRRIIVEADNLMERE